MPRTLYKALLIFSEGEIVVKMNRIDTFVFILTSYQKVHIKVIRFIAIKKQIKFTLHNTNININIPSKNIEAKTGT